jgi:predicted glycosyltransferase
MQTDMMVVDQKPDMTATDQTARSSASKKIWIDLDNSPHVPFFLPIMEELNRRGYQVLLTARDSYQVCELLHLYDLPCKVIGGHWGRNRLLKMLGTCLRALRLLPFITSNKPDLAVSHGSRAQTLASLLLGIPTLTMYDYEFTSGIPFVRSLWLGTPEYLPDLVDYKAKSRMFKYPGLKEDVYVPRFRPDPTLRTQLGISSDDLMILVRPPATEAHYHNPEAEVLFEAAMHLFMEQPQARVVLLPRNGRQSADLQTVWRKGIAERKIVIPPHAMDGLNLIWSSDLVVSGGGTMNREAAALGIPVYSIFRGTIGAVDRYLASQNRLVLLETVEDVRTKIALQRRQFTNQHSNDQSATLPFIVEQIVSIAERNCLSERR